MHWIALILFALIAAVTAIGMIAIVALIVVGTCGLAYDLWRRCADVIECDRRAGGLCVRCGYDLRSSPTRCPECGLAHRRSIWPRLASGSSVPIE